MTVLPLDPHAAAVLAQAERDYSIAVRRFEASLQKPVIFPQCQYWYRYVLGELETAERRLRTLRA